MSAEITGSWCPECGPNVKVDEECLCSGCGNSCTGPGAEQALAAVREREPVWAGLEKACTELERVHALIKSVEHSQNGCPWCGIMAKYLPHFATCPAFWPDGKVR